MIAYCSSNLLALTAPPIKKKKNMTSTGSQLSKTKLEEASKLLNTSGMIFIPNQGQLADDSGKLRSDVLYTAPTGNSNQAYLRKNGISYVFSNYAEVKHEVHEKVEAIEHSEKGLEGRTEGDLERELMKKEMVRTHQVDMNFLDCNTTINPVNSQQIQGYLNFYYEHCPDGILNVKQYQKVEIQNIYKGIDIVYHGGDQSGNDGLKYDFIVQPKADPNLIQLQWLGYEKMSLIDGKLKFKTNVNEFTESIPKVYQQINGKTVIVDAKYVLNTISGTESIVSFKLGEYDSNYALIIDPWAKYYGANFPTKSVDITIDNLDNVYLTGTTQSTSGFEYGGHQSLNNGFTDAFLVKFAADGTNLWSTYYGGGNSDSGNGVATDGSNVYITGNTNSTNGIATSLASGAHDNTFTNTSNAFLVKFNAAGMRQWGTYYGRLITEGYDVGCDSGGNVYLTGATDSPTIIATAGAHQTTYGGNTDVFLVKFNAAGARQWGTYYGGSGDDPSYRLRLAVDPNDNIFIGFNVGSSGLASLGAYQPTYNGVADAVIAKFSSAGVRQWATYLSVGNLDIALETDLVGDVYISSWGGASPAIPLNGAQNTYGGGTSDAFLMKYNAAGIKQWGTYFGGTQPENQCSMATDSDNNVYLYTEVEDLAAPNLIDPCAYQPNFGGVEDQIIIKYNSAGVKICATYVGGTKEDDLDIVTHGIANRGDNLVIHGYNVDGGYPTTDGSSSSVGTTSIFINSLCRNICEGKTLTVDFNTTTGTNCNRVFNPIINSCETTGYTYNWTFASGNPPTSTASNPNVLYPGGGVYSATLTVTTNGTCSNKTGTHTENVVIAPCTPLPVEFLGAKVYCEDNIAILKWATQSEQNNDRFEAFSSKDGIDWKLEGKQESADGNTTETQNYSMRLQTPTDSKTMYKLEQIDTDGYRTELGLVSGKDCGEFDDVILYPSATNGEFKIRHTWQTMDISIVNIEGKEVMKILNYDSQSTISIANFATGVYYCNMKNSCKEQRLAVRKL